MTGDDGQVTDDKGHVTSTSDTTEAGNRIHEHSGQGTVDKRQRKGHIRQGLDDQRQQTVTTDQVTGSRDQWKDRGHMAGTARARGHVTMNNKEGTRTRKRETINRGQWGQWGNGENMQWATDSGQRKKTGGSGQGTRDREQGTYDTGCDTRDSGRGQCTDDK